MQLDSIPLWALWVMAALGLATIFGVATMILPPQKRRRSGIGAAGVLALFVARMLISRDPRLGLWFAFSLGMALGLSLLTLVLPRGRAAYQEMSYSEQRTRGLLSGALMIAVATAVITSSIFWVH